MESPITQEEIKKELEKQIDLEKTCPLRLHFFTTHSGCHRLMDEFSRGNMPSSKLQIYIWMDATLKEVYHKLKRRAHTSVLQLFLWILKDLAIEERKWAAPCLGGRGW